MKNGVIQGICTDVQLYTVDQGVGIMDKMAPTNCLFTLPRFHL
jgi:hypothetical protein